MVNPKIISRKRKWKQKKKKGSEKDDGHVQLMQQLKAKYGNSKHEDEVTVAHIGTETLKVVHPSSYDRQMGRSVEAHLNRLMQPELSENVVQSLWTCCLCHKPTCYKKLGELFGPYLVPLNEFKTSPPSFLMPKHKKETSNEEPLLFDLWVHGDCALWAPDLHLLGGKFASMGKFISKYWKQNCVVCSEIGASIPINQNSSFFIHYPCAVDKGIKFSAIIDRHFWKKKVSGYTFDETTFVCKATGK